jgi:trk system potassium uptake protein TrkH
LLTALLIIIGTIAILAFEADNTLRDLSLKDRIWNSLFTSITPRTAGFETLPTSNLRPVSLFLLIMLMFIGASPGGTGGGIKTVTFAVILASFYTFFYNKDRISLFGRTIPRQTYRKAVSVLFLSMAIVGISTFLLSATEYFTLKGSNYFLSLLFESTSAFGTVGLSTGITPYLTPVGKLIIICTMFAGRVGPLTLALAVMMHREKIDYKYPEEQLMVG